MSTKEQEHQVVSSANQERDDLKELQKAMSIDLKQDEDSTKDQLKQRDVIYLLSLNWFNSWKQKVNYEDDGQAALDSNGIENGKVDIELPRLNYDLVDWEFINEQGDNLLKTDHEQYAIINIPIKDNMTENQDFMYVNKEIWDYLHKRYPDAIELPRIAYLDGSYTNIDLYFLKVNLLFLNSNDLKQASKSSLEDKCTRKMCLVPKKLAIGELEKILYQWMREDRICSKKLPSLLSEKDISKLFGIFKLDSNYSLTDFESDIKSTFGETTYHYQNQQIKIKGELLDESENFISDYEIFTGDNIIIDIKTSVYRDQNLRSPNMDLYDKCGYCSTVTKLKVKCPCGVGWCSEQCKKNDYVYHLKDCDRMEEDEPLPTQTKESCSGHRGLRNLGNTCYMSSGLQCQSNTSELTTYFLGKDYEKEINEDNPLGSGGKVLKAFVGQIHELWFSTSTVAFAPSRLKSAIGKFQTMFEGYGQHDSQELVSHLLDALHEDLNMIKKKPYVEGIEANSDENIEEVARKSWINYCKRNYSKISQQFYGQFKSTIKCPTCERLSITFDPFQQVSQPIQSVFSCQLEQYFIDMDHTKKAVKFEPKLKSMNRDFSDLYVHQLIEKLAENVEVKSEDLYFAFIGFSKRGSVINNNDSMKNIIELHRDYSFKPKLFLFEKSKQDIQLTGPDYRDKVIDTFGLAISAESMERGHSMRRSNIEKFPTFVKHIFAQENAPLQFIYKRLFEKIFNFIQFNDDQDDIKDENVNTDEMFKKYFLNESVGLNDMIFYIRVNDVRIDPSEMKPISSTFVDGVTWDQKKREFDYEIIFQNSNLASINFDEMKTCTGTNSTVKLSSIQKEESKVSNESTSDRYGTKKYNVEFSIETLIKKFTEPQQLDTDNMWYCSSCKDHVQAHVKMQIYKAPKYLIIHMKKLKGEGMGLMSRSSNFDSDSFKNIKFPVNNFDMGEYVINKETIDDYQISPDEFCDDNNDNLKTKMVEESQYDSSKPLLYDLYGVINHYGSMNFGHYTSYCKNDNTWKQYDDSNVSEVNNENDVVTDAAYVLFYKRKKL